MQAAVHSAWAHRHCPVTMGLLAMLRVCVCVQGKGLANVAKKLAA